MGAHLFPDLSMRRVDSAPRPMLEGEIPSPINLPEGCYLAGRCPQCVARCTTMKQDLTALPDGREVRCWRVAAGELVAAPAEH
jgi:oligopeptide/dipeptide ABC transporter ATP-binding protein